MRPAEIRFLNDLIFIKKKKKEKKEISKGSALLRVKHKFFSFLTSSAMTESRYGSCTGLVKLNNSTKISASYSEIVE